MATARSTPASSLPTQHTAPVFEYRCLYTHDLRRKAKRWQDGYLKFHTFNNRVVVYDVPKNYIGDTYHSNPNGLEDGDELELERGGVLVQVAERVAMEETDITPLVTRRTPKGIDQGEGQAARMPTALPPRSTSLGISQNTPGKWTGWTGRAQIPQESPFQQRKVVQRGTENDWEQGPSAKRQRQDDDEHVPLYQILKTSRPGIRSAINSVSSALSAGTANARITNRTNTTSTTAKRKTALPAGQARFQVKEVIDIASSPEEEGLPQQPKAQPQTVQRSQAPTKINVVQSKLSQTVNGRSLGPLRPEVVRAFKPPGSQASQAAGTHQQEKGGVFNSSSPARPETVKKARAPAPAKPNIVQAKLAQSVSGRQLGPLRPELVRTFRAPASQPAELAEAEARGAETPPQRAEKPSLVETARVTGEADAEPVAKKVRPATKQRRPAIEAVTPQRLPPSSPPVSTKNHLQPAPKTFEVDLIEDVVEKPTVAAEPKRPMKALRLGGSSRLKMLLFQQAPKSRPATPVEASKAAKEDNAIPLETEPAAALNVDLSMPTDLADSSPAFGTMDFSKPSKKSEQPRTTTHFHKQTMFIQDDSDDDDEEGAFESMVGSPPDRTRTSSTDTPVNAQKPRSAPLLAQAPAHVFKEAVEEHIQPVPKSIAPPPKPPPLAAQALSLEKEDVLPPGSMSPSITRIPSPPAALHPVPITANIHGPHPDIDNLMKPAINISANPVTSLTSKQPQAKVLARPISEPFSLAKPPEVIRSKIRAPSPDNGPRLQATTAKSNNAAILPKILDVPTSNAPPPKEPQRPSRGHENTADLAPPPSTAPTEPSPQKRQGNKPLTRATTISNPARAAKEQQKQQQQQAAPPPVVVDGVAFAKEKRLADEKKTTGPWTKEAWDMFGWCPSEKKEVLGWEYGKDGSRVDVADVRPAHDNLMGDQNGRMDQVRALGGFGRVGMDSVLA